MFPSVKRWDLYGTGKPHPMLTGVPNISIYNRMFSLDDCERYRNNDCENYRRGNILLINYETRGRFRLPILKTDVWSYSMTRWKQPSKNIVFREHIYLLPRLYARDGCTEISHISKRGNGVDI